jgi:hypothetical protein
MKTNKIIYWVSTGLLSALLLMSAAMYVFTNAEVSEMFKAFGYPTYLIYPLVVAKITAVIVLLTQKQSTIKEWVYSALFFEIVLAFFAHYMIGDGEQISAVIGLILLVVSYIYGRKLFNTVAN